MDISLVGNTAPTGQGPGDRSIAAIDPAAAAKAAAAPVETANAVEQPKAIPSLEQLTQAVKNINKAMESMSQSLEFSVDTDTKRTVVKVIDRQTKDVIRQIPSEEALEIAKALDQVSGLLIRQKA